MGRVEQASTIRRLAVLSYAEHRVMVMLKAYFDESGHSSAPGYRPFAVGGCVAPLERWEIFEEEWKRILARFDVKCFHATDLAAYQGEFRDWNDARRKEFMGILVGLVRQYVA